LPSYTRVTGIATASEQDLIRQAKAGNKAAFEDLLRPSLPPAARLARVLLGDPAESEDAVQEAAVKAWRKLDNLREGAGFLPWFLGIVVRQVRSIQRGRWWALIRLPDVPNGTVDVEGPWLAREELRQAVARLPLSQREAIAMHFYPTFRVSAGASALGLSTAGVKSRLNRGLRRLRADVGQSEALV
jgi:RNA polymerase sigma factor (sigma-70 family)